ncbi:uncharacterized protein [Apostichopus japonicus]|uniref:uncharacterized protein n=1 Tax=Stichopus japonicus TaxID=307972 RepID=UPI003AB58190
MLSRHMNEFQHHQTQPALHRRSVWKKVVSTLNCCGHSRSNTYEVPDQYEPRPSSVSITSSHGSRNNSQQRVGHVTDRQGKRSSPLTTESFQPNYGITKPKSPLNATPKVQRKVKTSSSSRKRQTSPKNREVTLIQPTNTLVNKGRPPLTNQSGTTKLRCQSRGIDLKDVSTIIKYAKSISFHTLQSLSPDGQESLNETIKRQKSFIKSFLRCQAKTPCHAVGLDQEFDQRHLQILPSSCRQAVRSPALPQALALQPQSSCLRLQDQENNVNFNCSKDVTLAHATALPKPRDVSHIPLAIDLVNVRNAQNNGSINHIIQTPIKPHSSTRARSHSEQPLKLTPLPAPRELVPGQEPKLAINKQDGDASRVDGLVAGSRSEVELDGYAAKTHKVLIRNVNIARYPSVSRNELPSEKAPLIHPNVNWSQPRKVAITKPVPFNTDATAEPIEATAEPVTATTEPDEGTAEPDEATAKSVKPTTEQVKATAELLKVTAEQLVCRLCLQFAITKPAPIKTETTTEPVEATVAKPIKATAEPVIATAEPDEATADPVEATAELVKAIAEPFKAKAELVKETAEPVKETVKPIKTTAEQVNAKSKPVQAMTELVLTKHTLTPDKNVVVRKTTAAKLQHLFPECELLLQSDLQHILHPTTNKPITLGKGAFGVVRLMKNIKTGRLCAVKTFQNHLMNAKIFKDAKVEVQMLTKLRGLKCVPELFGIVPAEGNTGVPSVVQEFIGDQDTLMTCTIKTAIRKKIFSADIIVRVALSIVKALIDVQSRGIFHCDLKPDNIMLMPELQGGQDPHIKIIDFGRAVSTANKPKYEHLTPERQGEVLQRSAHIAPEVVLGLLPYSENSEMYSLGKIFIRMAGDRSKYLKKIGKMCMHDDFRQRPTMKKLKEELTSYIGRKQC